MDRNIEDIFLNNFIDKRIRDRIRFELNKEEKRIYAISRFCHRTEDIIIKSNILTSNKKLKYEEILKLLRKYGAQKNCYVISSDSEIDGKTMTLDEALDTCHGLGMPSIIICIPDHLAYIECEQEQGPADKYILYK